MGMLGSMFGGGSGDDSELKPILESINAALIAIQNKEAKIIIGDKVVDAIRVEGSINSSYRIGTGGALEG